MHEYTNTSTKTYFYAIILVSDSAGQGNISELNITDIMIGAFLGAAGGALGGSGGGSNHMDALSNQLFKRIGNAFEYQSGNALKEEISKAIAYYIKSSSKQIIAIMYSVLKSYIPAVIEGGVEWIDDLFKDYIVD